MHKLGSIYHTAVVSRFTNFKQPDALRDTKLLVSGTSHYNIVEETYYVNKAVSNPRLSGFFVGTRA